MYTKENILNDLSKLNIDPNGTLFVHSSYKSLGNVQGGVDTFIDALMEYMKDGLLVLPTHTWNNVNIDTNPVFDVLETPVCIGIIPELFRKRENVVRSNHPTHSVAAFGKDAKDYIAGEELCQTPCAKNSIYYKLIERNASILLVGVDFTRNTFIHGIEEWNSVPNRVSDRLHKLFTITVEGEKLSTPQYRHCSKLGSRTYWKIEGIMEEKGAMQRGKICDADVMVCNASNLNNILSEMLSENIDLLTDNEPLSDYRRKLAELPRVFAINDLSGFGKCALSIAVPVINACGVEVLPVPTSILSTNTKFKGFKLVDFTEHIPSYIEHWSGLNIKGDILYTGFLSSTEQVSIVESFIDKFKPPLVVIDPIMGDNGKLYSTFNQELCDRIKLLVKKADLVLPNLTEAHILASTTYDGRTDLSVKEVKVLIKKILKLGCKKIIIKGIERNNEIINCYFDGEKYDELSLPLLPFKIFGTGDLFASVLVGKLAKKTSLEKSILLASKFVSVVMSESLNYKGYEQRGLCFEPYLESL